ncbi:MAG: ABC transporter ATP-binding protein [Bacteroidota bacterium]
MAQPILSVASLSIGYGSKTILENLDFSIPKGRFVGIVGVNGVGKSTLMRTLGGFQSALAGEIRLENQPLQTILPNPLAKLRSVVLTEQGVTQNLTVQELIALGRYPYTNWWGKLTIVDHEQISKSLKRLELIPLKDCKFHELSDGQRQRVWLARALAQQTPVILLDEPTTHLDLYHKIQILKMLQNISHTEEKTILFTTHEINIALQLCDNILLLDPTISAFGTPTELIAGGHFQRLFPKGMVDFDEKTGAFVIK